MKIEINGLTVGLSEKTLDAYTAHAAYCSAGTNWLLKNDPKCQQENMLIQEIIKNLREDYELAVANVLSIIHDSLMDSIDFNNQQGNEFLELIDKAM